MSEIRETFRRIESVRNRKASTNAPWSPPATLELSKVLLARKQGVWRRAQSSHQKTVEAMKKRINEMPRNKDIAPPRPVSSPIASRNTPCEFSEYSSKHPDSPMSTSWDPYRELRRRIVSQIMDKHLKGTLEGFDLLQRMRERALATTSEELHGLRPKKCVEVIDALARSLFPEQGAEKEGAFSH